LPLNEEGVKSAVKTMRGYRKAEEPRLERIALYVKDPGPGEPGRMTLANGTTIGPLAWLPSATPDDVKRLAHIARVNMLKFVVDATVQVMYVDGYRTKDGTEQPQWETWQRNRMDARQIGVHRSSLTYGASYATVLPGDTAAVIRGVGPRKMTVVYGADGDDWPIWALEERRSMNAGRKLWRLYDAEATYWVETDDKDNVYLVGTEVHGLGVTPVVRFRPTIDDDDDGEGAAMGEVEPLIPLQDQINITTFGLLVAQHYGAFRQRYILGWIADSEEQALTASARKLWTFEDENVKVGEFGQTDLKGYIDSREATLRHLATISQTPAHELLGQLANLSAEALAAAEANHRRKVEERQTVMGEAWEQVLELAGAASSPALAADPMAYVRWRDTEARSLATVADALGKMVTMLGIPPQELWERIPGVTQQEVERWKVAAKSGDAIAQLAAVLDAQAGAADAEVV
jgi:hypothetical protein